MCFIVCVLLCFVLYIALYVFDVAALWRNKTINYKGRATIIKITRIRSWVRQWYDVARCDDMTVIASRLTVVNVPLTPTDHMSFNNTRVCGAACSGLNYSRVFCSL